MIKHDCMQNAGKVSNSLFSNSPHKYQVSMNGAITGHAFYILQLLINGTYQRFLETVCGESPVLRLVEVLMGYQVVKVEVTIKL